MHFCYLQGVSHHHPGTQHQLGPQRRAFERCGASCLIDAILQSAQSAWHLVTADHVVSTWCEAAAHDSEHKVHILLMGDSNVAEAA